MASALERRLARLEAQTTADDGRGVHGIPAHSEEEFEAKRSAMIVAGDARPRDLFIHLQRFAEPAEPVTYATSVSTLFDDINARGRRIFDPQPEPTL